MTCFFKRIRRQQHFMAAHSSGFVCGSCLLVLAGFCSCSFFNEPVREYFERSMLTAAIVRHEICTDHYPYPKSGADCVASTSDTRINLYLRNPSHYQFTQQENIRFSFDDPGVGALPETVSVVQDENDASVMCLTYPAAFLKQCEEQNEHNVSCWIHLTYEIDKTHEVLSDSYMLNLHCDTKPPQLYAAAYADSATHKYAVLFALPPASELSIHRDIRLLSIGGEQFAVSIDSNGTAIFSSSSIIQGTAPADFSPVETEFNPPSGGQPFYYILNNLPSNCDITLTDNAGFSSTTPVYFGVQEFVIEVAGGSSETLTFAVVPDDGSFTVAAHDSSGTDMSVTVLSVRCIDNDITDAGVSISDNFVQFPHGWKGNAVYQNLKYQIAVAAEYNGYAYGCTLEYFGTQLGL